MATIGRNDPCPCKSGKKYKHCHATNDAAAATAARLLRKAPTTLVPKLLEAVPRFVDELPVALGEFWNDAYAVEMVQELDEHEGRGSERFLTWFVFDHGGNAGSLCERLAQDPSAPAALGLTEAEAQILKRWCGVRLQPYVVEAVRPGIGFTVRPLFGDQLCSVEDRAATERVSVGDVLIMHLLPVAEESYEITGAAAHLTGDTIAPLRRFAEHQLAHLQNTLPDATYSELIQQRSYSFNHYIMTLPRAV